MATVNLGRVGFVLKGDWDNITQYVLLDVVSHDGNSWVAKRTNTNVEPTTENSDDWQLISNNADLVSTVQGYKEDAAGSATDAENSAEDAEAWAVGQRNGTDVDSDDPAYHNNAKYYSEQAGSEVAAKAVRYDAAQSLTDSQQSQARENINAAAADDVDDLDDRVTALEAGAIGDMDLETFNRCIVMGIGAKAGPVGTALTTEKETGISVTIGTSGGGTPGVTGATVAESTFIAKIGHSDPGAYEFTYDGAAWHLDGAAVELSQYGITPTGTPSPDDEIVVHVTATSIAMNVLDHDYHTPANSAIPHTCTIGMRDCFENRQFDAPEALIKVVDGLAAGSHFYLTLYKGAYGGNTGQDGTYGGTLGAEQAIPAGGYLRHTTMGQSQSGGYDASQITGGKWIAYDTSFNQIGANIDTDSGDTTGTNFGTATASTYQGNSEHVNFTERNAYGCNRVDQSAWLQYANAEGTGWWVQKNEWDFPPASVSTIKGFLTGIDPAMKAAMVKTKIRVALPNCDGGGYVDIETYVFPLSMTEVGFGQNNSQYETSWGVDNTLKTTALSFFQGATNADRIKTLNGADRYWFLRGPYPSYARNVRSVHTDGSLDVYSASVAYGFVAAWVIGNPVIQTA